MVRFASLTVLAAISGTPSTTTAYTTKGIGGLANTHATHKPNAANSANNNGAPRPQQSSSSALALVGDNNNGNGGAYYDYDAQAPPAPMTYDPVRRGPPGGGGYLDGLNDDMNDDMNMFDDDRYPMGPPYDQFDDEFGYDPSSSSTYNPLFNNERGSSALARTGGSTGRLSDMGKREEQRQKRYNAHPGGNYDIPVPSLGYDKYDVAPGRSRTWENTGYDRDLNRDNYNNNLDRFEEYPGGKMDLYDRYDRQRQQQPGQGQSSYRREQSSTFKPLFASSRDHNKHPQNMRRDELAAQQQEAPTTTGIGRRSKRLSDEGKQQQRNYISDDTRPTRGGSRDMNNAPPYDDQYYGEYNDPNRGPAPTRGRRSVRLSDEGKEEERRLQQRGRYISDDKRPSSYRGGSRDNMNNPPPYDDKYYDDRDRELASTGRRSVRLSDEGKDEERRQRRQQQRGRYISDDTRPPRGDEYNDPNRNGRRQSTSSRSDMGTTRSSDGHYDRNGRWQPATADRAGSNEDRYEQPNSGGLSGRLSDQGKRSSSSYSTYKPLFDSKRDGPHPQNSRRDASDNNGRSGGSTSAGSTGRLSDQGKEYYPDNRDQGRRRRYQDDGPNYDDYMQRRGGGGGSAPLPPRQLQLEHQSEVGRERRYSGGIAPNSEATKRSSSSTFKPLFGSNKPSTIQIDQEYDPRREQMQVQGQGTYRASDDGHEPYRDNGQRREGGRNGNTYDPNRSPYYKYGTTSGDFR